MKKEIVIPKLRPEMQEAVVCAWLKEVGDPVKKGEPIFEIETDKVVTQVESGFEGTLVEQCCEEGDTVGEIGSEIWRRHWRKRRIYRLPLLL